MRSFTDQRIIEGLADEDWNIDTNRAWIMVGDREIDIEFCIGDFCVGVYDKDKELEEGKFREPTLKAAAKKARQLLRKYAQ